ncbi:peptidoglycan DD-metalloendopeptidase family protein [Candidatus Doolittlea endobia]|uniref:Murein hydrolase activator NlpD n=1 Tax=Candidatus Doolittlea endobia TaxID=1778262 RepID=A0A143WS01_9ENTR|nr:peptidoglycan DD-metalloendopeptidase family protein [Candidatus Doolittlea endobia]CUX96480.1 Murein hydrolase activator NlpD precursor [Candidatus Doolittlea endobia]
MRSPKRAWRQVAFCSMASIWWAGCTNTKSSVPISSVGVNYVGSDIAAVGCALQNSQPHAVINSNEQSQINVSSQGNIIYKRSYNNIRKNTFSGATYQVKRGDTLFYIAWITGNDYRVLAKRNNIPEHYSLHVGQTLQVGNGTVPIIGNVMSRIILTSNAYQRKSGATTTSVPTLHQHLTTSNVNSNKNNNSFERKMLPLPNSVSTNSTSITDWCWPTDGKIIDKFSGAEGGNRGVDISGFRGQPILATASGRAVYTGNALRGYGNLIIIKHNDNYLSAYAHNDTLLIQAQQEVRTGQTIATMGNTGTSTTRLHFEIRYKGQPVNPLSYLPQR